MTLRKFKVNAKLYKSLSSDDKKTVKILEGVVKDAAPLYELQFKQGFYPRNITKRDIEKEADVNPEILSAFTYVQYKNGHLEAVPYHIHYVKFLKPMSAKIEKAAKFATNPSFKAYLLARAKAMLDGSWVKAYAAWMKVKGSKIDFYLGPIESHVDKLLSIKRIFQGYVGIIDPQATQQAEEFKETLYASAKMSFSKYHSTDIAKKGVQVFVEQTPVISGYPADTLSSGQQFPRILDLALEHGSRITTYQSQYTLKFEKLYYPIFKTIFDKRFAARYSKQLLLEATGHLILLYELGKQLHKFQGVRDRLQELYSPIDEANGFASGIEHSKHLVVKGLLSQEQLEAIMIIHIVWMLADWLTYRKKSVKESHIIGNSILLNSYLTHGALKESSGMSWPNFSRMFFEIESMTYKMVYLLQKGSYKEAESFLKKNANVQGFERLATSLSNIDTHI